MPEPEKSNSPKSPDSPGGEKTKPPKTKTPKSPDGLASSRSLSSRVERSLKDVDRLLKRNPDVSPEERVRTQLEQAKVSALLQLAESIREARRAEGPPRA
jgi:hypothetical protein